jgi:hypothetical protein
MRRFVSRAAIFCALLLAPWVNAAEIAPLPAIAPDSVEGLTIAQLEEQSGRGDLKARAELGARYARGAGVSADLKKAVSLFEQAAKKGEPNAQYYLGTAYDRGAGVKKDPAQAARWFGTAASQNHAGGQYALGVMMTDGQGKLKADPKAAAELVAKAAEQGFYPAAIRMAGLYITGIGVPRDPEKAAYWYRRILKTRPDQQATVGLITLIETKEVKWQPGDPGSAPSEAPQPPAAVQQPPVKPSGRVTTEVFKTDRGVTFETRAEDGRLSLFSTSAKPYNCELRVTFTYREPSGARKDGDWVCFKAERPAGKKVFLCTSTHENFVDTDVKGVEFSRCDEPSTK